MAIGIIACSVLKKEILKVLQGKKNIGEIVFLDAALHLEPDKHRLAVLDAIKSMPENILLIGYGKNCSYNLEDYVKERASVPCVFPNADHCIAILLGQKRYEKEMRDAFFLTPGWIDNWNEIERKLQKLIGSNNVFESANRLIYVDTGVGNQKYVAFAEKFSQKHGLKLEIINGSLDVLGEAFIKLGQYD